MTLSAVAAPFTLIAPTVLPEMTFPAPATVPPMVLPLAPLKIWMPPAACRVRQRRCTRRIQADVVALHHIAGRRRALDRDAGDRVSRDDVARRGGEAADPVVRRRDTRMPPEPFGRARVPVGSVPMKLPSTTLPPLTFERDRVEAEPVDDHAADDRVAAADDEARHLQPVAVQLDFPRDRLRGAVDDHRLVDQVKAGLQRDRRHTAAGDVEDDGVPVAAVRVRNLDGLPERSRSAVGRRGDCEGAARGIDDGRLPGAVVGWIGLRPVARDSGGELERLRRPAAGIGT